MHSNYHTEKFRGRKKYINFPLDKILEKYDNSYCLACKQCRLSNPGKMIVKPRIQTSL